MYLLKMKELNMIEQIIKVKQSTKSQSSNKDKTGPQTFNCNIKGIAHNAINR